MIHEKCKYAVTVRRSVHTSTTVQVTADSCLAALVAGEQEARKLPEGAWAEAGVMYQACGVETADWPTRREVDEVISEAVDKLDDVLATSESADAVKEQIRAMIVGAIEAALNEEGGG